MTFYLVCVLAAVFTSSAAQSDGSSTAKVDVSGEWIRLNLGPLECKKVDRDGWTAFGTDVSSEDCSAADCDGTLQGDVQLDNAQVKATSPDKSSRLTFTASFEASRKYSPALASDSKYKELQDVVWTFVSGLRMRITGCIPGREYTIKTWHHDISAQECHPHHSAYLRDYVIPNKLWRVQVTGAKGSKTYIETPSRAGAKVGTNGEDDLFAVEAMVVADRAGTITVQTTPATREGKSKYWNAVNALEIKVNPVTTSSTTTTTTSTNTDAAANKKAIEDALQTLMDPHTETQEELQADVAKLAAALLESDKELQATKDAFTNVKGELAGAKSEITEIKKQAKAAADAATQNTETFAASVASLQAALLKINARFGPTVADDDDRGDDSSLQQGGCSVSAGCTPSIEADGKDLVVQACCGSITHKSNDCTADICSLKRDLDEAKKRLGFP